VDAGIGGRVEAVEQIGTLQHHGGGGSGRLLLPAELEQIDACEGGGRGSGSATRLKGTKDAAGGGGGGGISCWLGGLLGGITKAIAQNVGDGKGERWFRLLRLLMRWRRLQTGNGSGSGVIHINVIVLLILLLLLRGGCGRRLIVKAITQYGVALLLLDVGQGRRGGGGGGRRSAETLLQRRRMQRSGVEAGGRMMNARLDNLINFAASNRCLSTPCCC